MGRVRDGLRWVRTSDALRAFVSQHGGCAPRRAVFCTYDFDVERFEAILYPELARRGRHFRTVVMVDAGALQAHLGQASARRATRYEVAPVRCRRGGVFHPKLILLVCGRHCLVGFGSANLTAGGLGGNLELMLFADNTNDTGRRLVGEAARFLERLFKSNSILPPASTREFVDLAIAGIPQVNGVLIDSFDESLLSQMTTTHRKWVGPAVPEEVAILSPWHSGAATPDGLDPSVLQKIRTSFGAPIIKLFTEGRNGRGPDLGAHVPVHIRAEQQTETRQAPPPGDDLEDDLAFDRRPMRVHAKAYLIRQRHGGGTLFFGSANCTHPALTKSVGHGGNVELLVGTRLQAAEVGSFQNDLKDLFSPAARTFTPSAAPLPPKVRGRVLCGQVFATKAGVRLRLEVPEMQTGHVSIAATPNSRVVRVRIIKGVGLVEDHWTLCKLSSEDPAGPDSIPTGVLWERIGRPIPFPVSTPVISQDASNPEQALLDLVWEELGVWPSFSDPDVTDGSPDTDEEENRPEDDDLKALAETRHQGQLDRIAVAVSVMRKHILSADARTEYARIRLGLLCRRISGLAFPDHLRNALLKYLDPRRLPRRKRGR